MGEDHLTMNKHESSDGAMDLRILLQALTAYRKGDFTVRLPAEWTGVAGRVADAFNATLEVSEQVTRQLEHVSRGMGVEGRLSARASAGGAEGAWAGQIAAANALAEELMRQVSELGRVIGAVAAGDLTQTMSLEIDGRPLRGDALQTARGVNAMVGQLGHFADEVRRVTHEVGTEGKLGVQARVTGFFGAWKDLIDNVNMMAGNLTAQVRTIAEVTTAVAIGDLSSKITVDARGEILYLKETINAMVDRLGLFAAEVTRVAREVGTEGKLGGQANVPGAAGTWKDLIDNVNQFAANVTDQVHAIAEVSTAVTKGDLTRSIRVEARGEVAALGNNVNEMIRNLRETTQKNTEQDWLKTNLAKFTRMMHGQHDLAAVCQLILSELAPVVSAQHGVLYVVESASSPEPGLKLVAAYASTHGRRPGRKIQPGEGLVGQCALEKKKILLTSVPAGYIEIRSGLGQAAPLNIVLLPILFEGQLRAVVELASFELFSPIHQAFLDQLTESIGIVMNTLDANMRTEELLGQSVNLARQLQSQQEELQQANEELQEKARLLSIQNQEVERKNAEIERARSELEEKAGQLALSSRYKSEFLSNMSHELRTPLTSLLLLSQQLAENSEGNLRPQQVEYARAVHASGSELLSLINDILDLAKIESGTVTVQPGEVLFADLALYCERTFRQIARSKGLEFTIGLGPSLPRAIHTDGQRLRQVLKNLLSNALKFTEKGRVVLRIAVAAGGWSKDHEVLNRASAVVSFEVRDAGIGIAAEKHRSIFEAFQQADGTTSRKFGGTGLGLSISREVSRLLHAEIRLSSEPGLGSTFTLYLPLTCQGLELPESDPAASHRGTTAAVLPAAFGAARAPKPARAAAPSAFAPSEGAADDRDQIGPEDRVLMIVEDDLGLARILLDQARKKGFKGLLATDGGSALSLAVDQRLDAVTLDIGLPDMNGWVVLDWLKHNPDTRHIPVHVISIAEDRNRATRWGAVRFLQKPFNRRDLDGVFASIQGFLDRPRRSLLVVESDPSRGRKILELLDGDGIQTAAVESGQSALSRIGVEAFDCLVVSPDLPDMSALALIAQLRRQPALQSMPIIVFANTELEPEQKTALLPLAHVSLVEGPRSDQVLVEKVTLFLHQMEARLPKAQQRALANLRQSEPRLAGRRVLVVDDDVRNIFALTATLERHGVNVLSAENGVQALRWLGENASIEAVLMDIMMPEMDGYEAIRAIRQNPRWRDLPVIAVSAKAMKGDREKCIEAGASDYLAKPVDPQLLVSQLRVWLDDAARTW